MFRVGRATISNILRETCAVIWNATQELYVKAPTTAAEWLNIADEFANHWQFPNCIEALDGKHIAIDCPQNGGSMYL